MDDEAPGRRVQRLQAALRAEEVDDRIRAALRYGWLASGEEEVGPQVPPQRCPVDMPATQAVQA